MLKENKKFVEECFCHYLSNLIFEMLFSCTKIKAESKKKYNYVRKQLNIYKTKPAIGKEKFGHLHEDTRTI